MTVSVDEPSATKRVEETRRRHGDDFYARIGWISHELRQRARAGDEEALAAIERRRTARAQRRAAWRELVAAREAVHLLREELRSRARANAGRAALDHSYQYSSRLWEELQQAEARLADVTARHEHILEDLRALPDDISADEPAAATPAAHARRLSAGD